jgi:outer membrane protein assembly factor BamB
VSDTHGLHSRRQFAALSALVLLAAALFALAASGAGTVFGGDTSVEPSHDSNSPGRAEAFRLTATASGTVQTISVYVDATSTATKLVAGLYTNTSSGHPGALLGRGSLSTPMIGAWNDVSISSVDVTSGATYWIAILGPSGTLQFRDNCCTGASETSSQQTLTDVPSTWTTGTRYTDGPLSAYVTGATATAPTLVVAPTALSFSATSGGSDPGPTSVSVSNSGPGSLSFTTASDAPWLTAAPTGGTTPTSVNVSVSSAGLAAGTYIGHVAVTAAGAVGSPATVTVTFTVTPAMPPSPFDWLQIDHDSSRSGNAAAETTITPGNASSLAQLWARQLDGKVTAQPLFVKGAYVSGAVHDTVVAATNSDSIYTLDGGTGTVLWRRSLGAPPSSCSIPGGFGVTGAPAIDKTNGRIYAVSDDGKLYTLALGDGSDAQQPLQLISDYATNKVWGGLTLRGSDLYVATASDGCDTTPWRGRIFRIGVGGSTPQILNEWDVVPGIAAPNGGGGIWGYGGVSTDSSGNIYAATADDSNESFALFADRLVALTSTLAVQGSYLPSEPTTFPCAGAPCDLDFGATPLVFQPTGCPTLVAAGNKNGNLYLFRTTDLAASGQPLQTLQLNGANDSLGNGGVGGVPAYWSAGNMVFASDAGAGISGIAGGAVGLAVQPNCTLSVAWSAAQGGSGAPNSTPTVANGVVFVGTGSTGSVQAYDARTGTPLWSSGALGSTFAAPSVADGRLFVGSWDGSSNSALGTIRAYAPGAPDGAAPQVSVTAPTGGTTVSGSISLSATASDNVGVVGVQFSVDGVNVGSEDTTFPYSVLWDSTTVGAGSHTITATARDAAGNRTTSTGIVITVDNSVPPPLRVLLGDPTIEASPDSNTAGKAEAFRTTASSSGTLTRLTVYVPSTNAAPTLVTGLYSDASGKPGTLLTHGTASIPAGGGWINATVPSAAVTAGTTYWIAVLSPAGTATLQFRDKSSGGASETSSGTNLIALPTTWATGARYTDGSLSATGSGT